MLDRNTLTFVFDIDGTICPLKQKGQKYEDLVPYPAIVEKIREYKKQGANIVLYTSRNMNTYDGDIGKINIVTAPIILEWLKKWDIPFDEIIYGKVWPGFNGFYVDDRTIRPNEFMKYDVDELNKICSKSRLDEE